MEVLNDAITPSHVCRRPFNSGGGSPFGGRRLHDKRNRDAERADAAPIAVDVDANNWAAVGGLDHHVRALKEMVMLPMLYPEVFARFDITPPRGVIFHGPPGCGKTLVARALAASCSSCGAGGRKVAFFMRK